MCDVDADDRKNNHPAVQDVEINLGVQHTPVPAARELDDPVYRPGLK